MQAIVLNHYNILLYHFSDQWCPVRDDDGLEHKMSLVCLTYEQ